MEKFIEIDLVDIIKTIYKKKVFLILFILCILILTFIYNKVATKQYKADASFYLYEDEMSAGKSSIAGYAEMFGVKTNQNLDPYVKSILDSKRIKMEIANVFHRYFKQEIDQLISEKKLNDTLLSKRRYIVKQLQLKTNFTVYKDKNGTFKISYFYKNKQMSKQVLESYLDILHQLNIELGVTSQKKIITIIDPPELREHQYKPRPAFNLALALMGSFIFGIGFILIRSYLKKFLAKF